MGVEALKVTNKYGVPVLIPVEDIGGVFASSADPDAPGCTLVVKIPVSVSVATGKTYTYDSKEKIGMQVEIKESFSSIAGAKTERGNPAFHIATPATVPAPN